MTKTTSIKPNTTAEPEQIHRFLRRPQVLEATGLKTSTLYDMMLAGRFPRPVRISKRLVVWPEHEVVAWQAARIAEVRK